jgi:PAS domain-containing protein
MTDWSSNVHELHPSGSRLVLRARAAEQLIQATDTAAAARALFELIAAELKLNVFLLHALDEVGALRLVAHAGLSEAMAAEVESQGPPRFKGGRAGPVEIAAVQARDDHGTAVLRSIGLKSYFSMPLMAGADLIGFLGFGRRWTDRFNDEDQAFLIDVGGYLALALERVRWESRLREGEERLRLAMEVAGFGTLDFNLDTGRAVWSPEAIEIRGFSSDRPTGINDVKRNVNPDDHERVRREWEASFQPDGPGTWDFEYRLMMPDGTERWIHSCGRTFFPGRAGRAAPSGRSAWCGTSPRSSAPKSASGQARNGCASPWRRPAWACSNMMSCVTTACAHPPSRRCMASTATGR